MAFYVGVSWQSAKQPTSWGRRKTYRRNIGEVARTHDPALVAVPELHEALGGEEDIMGLFVPMKARRIRQHSAAGEDGDAALGLLGRGKDAEDAFAAGDGDALTLELVDDVARPCLGRCGDDGDAHGDGVGRIERTVKWTSMTAAKVGEVHSPTGRMH